MFDAILHSQSESLFFNRHQPTTAQRCRSETETFILEDLFSSVLSQFKKYHIYGNLTFNNLGIFQSLKLRILEGKILPISLLLNFTPNTLDCYGLKLISHTFAQLERNLLIAEKQSKHA